MKLSAFICAILFAAAAPVAAAAAVWTADLSGENVVPPNASPGSGTVTVTYDEATQVMSFDIVYADLQSGPTNWRLHCCAGPGVNTSAAIIEFDAVIATSGNYVFSRNLTTGLTPGFVTSFGGGNDDAAIAALIAGLNAGEAYFIIATAAFPGGEVRGQLALVPLPAAAWMFIAGAALLAGRARVLRRNAA